MKITAIYHRSRKDTFNTPGTGDTVMLESRLQEEYLAILQEELVPAMGSVQPEHILARCSGNMIKNVRYVTIPNSGGIYR